jgi:hypothetical protein
MRFTQIAVQNETKNLRAAIWALSSYGEIYFLVFSEGVWRKQEGPSEHTLTQPIKDPTSGADIIALERNRQIREEGFSPEHDDEHIKGELAAAAECYVAFATDQLAGANPGGGTPLQWPWSAEWWKPSPDPIKNLKRGAALCAAEIDRLKRKG